MHAMPLLLGVLCLFAIAYRYYSAFLAAKAATLDDSRVTLGGNHAGRTIVRGLGGELYLMIEPDSPVDDDLSTSI